MLGRSDLSEDQEIGIDRLFEYDETFLIAPTGSGKSVMVLTAISELIQAGELSRVLIIAPLKVCLTTWAHEQAKWDHLEGLNISHAVGPEHMRRKALESYAEIVVINEENAAWAFQAGYYEMFYGCVIDETSRWSATGGKRFKKLRNKMKHFKWRVGMTAEPVSENWIKIFGQILLIDLGKALGKNRERYQRKHFYTTDWEQRNWVVLPGQHEKIAERIRSVVHVVPDYKVEKLPPKTVTYVPITLPEEAFRRYNRMRIDSRLKLKSMNWDLKLKAKNRAVKSGKLEQIAAGFSYVRDGEAPDDFFGPAGEAPGETRKPAVFHHNEKLVWARKRANEILNDGESVIIVYWFQWELEMLRTYIPGALEINGTPTQIRQAMKQWRERPSQVMFLQPSSASHGVDGLQDTCHRQLWLDPIWSRDKTNQCGDRLWRWGQDHEVFIEVAVARGTVDEIKVSSVTNNAEHMKKFLDHLGGGEELSPAEIIEIEGVAA